jgi:hypothetical protein
MKELSKSKEEIRKAEEEILRGKEGKNKFLDESNKERTMK